MIAAATHRAAKYLCNGWHWNFENSAKPVRGPAYAGNIDYVANVLYLAIGKIHLVEFSCRSATGT